MLAETLAPGGRYNPGHLTWFAFFSPLVVWLQPRSTGHHVKEDLGLSLSNPLRCDLHMWLSRASPHPDWMVLDKLRTSNHLIPHFVFSAFPCLLCKRPDQSTDCPTVCFTIVGAGFVIGIRMVAIHSDMVSAKRLDCRKGFTAAGEFSLRPFPPP